jgi:hypothetical protein
MSLAQLTASADDASRPIATIAGADALITLDEAARFIPGATADTLKRRARQGKLTTYRPGKAYLTTAADVQRMVAACRVEQKAPGSISAPLNMTAPENSRTNQLGLSSTDLASAGLDSALASLAKPKKR